MYSSALLQERLRGGLTSNALKFQYPPHTNLEGGRLQISDTLTMMSMDGAGHSW